LPPDREEDAFRNPWESFEGGLPAAFYRTVVRVLFAAPLFFAALEPRRALLRPLIFYLLVGLVQILTERFWLMLFAGMSASQPESDPQLARMMSLLAADAGLPMIVLVRSAVITLWLFLLCALYHLMIHLVAPGRADFSLAFQVLAYASAPAVLSIVPVLGTFVGFFWSVAGSIIGCRHAFRLTWPQTVTALAPLYLIVFFLVLKAVSGAPT
jgi:hypothetical protein